MKLYEFTYWDNLNLSEEGLLERVESFLQKECESQGWASDYTCRQVKPFETSASGERQYFFEVVGTFLSDKDVDDEKIPDVDYSQSALAAKEAST